MDLSAFGKAIIATLTGIVGLAILAVLVSKSSNTAGVITAAGNAFAHDLNVAVSPIQGQYGGLTSSGGSNILDSLGGVGSFLGQSSGGASGVSSSLFSGSTLSSLGSYASLAGEFL